MKPKLNSRYLSRLIRQGITLAGATTSVLVVGLLMLTLWIISQLYAIGFWILVYHFGIWMILPPTLSILWALSTRAPVRAKIALLLVIGLMMTLMMQMVEGPLIPIPHETQHPYMQLQLRR